MRRIMILGMLVTAFFAMNTVAVEDGFANKFQFDIKGTVRPTSGGGKAAQVTAEKARKGPKKPDGGKKGTAGGGSSSGASSSDKLTITVQVSHSGAVKDPKVKGPKYKKGDKINEKLRDTAKKLKGKYKKSGGRPKCAAGQSAEECAKSVQDQVLADVDKILCPQMDTVPPNLGGQSDPTDPGKNKKPKGDR